MRRPHSPDYSFSIHKPTWANWTVLTGIAIDIVELGIMISQISVYQNQYLEKIVASFNKNTASN